MNKCNVKNCPDNIDDINDNCWSKNVENGKIDQCSLYIEYNELINRKLKIDNKELDSFTTHYANWMGQASATEIDAITDAFTEMGWYEEKKSKLEEARKMFKELE